MIRGGLMGICNIQDNDICLNCHFTPPSEHGDVCRYVAEYWLTVLFGDIAQEIPTTKFM